MHKFLFYISTLVFGFQGICQTVPETPPPNYIRTISLTGNDTQPAIKTNPAIPLHSTLTLSFDDLIGDEADYFYTIEHYDYNWQLSQLSKNEFLEGIDNVRIMNYQNSYNTLQPYSHYQLQIPNQYTKALKVSGNYMIKIFNENKELVFSRKFMLFEEKTPVATTIVRARDLNYIHTKQVVNFQINTKNFPVKRPEQTIKILITQNHNLKTAIKNIKPQYTLGNELIYKYDLPTSFWGGNEYLKFDTKDLRGTSAAISHISLDELYHHYLTIDLSRETTPYTYNPDINGNYVIRQLNAESAATEAEYTWVHFQLKNYESIGKGNLHIYGAFNNFSIDESTKLHLNKETGYYETARLFKQGYYDYKYILVKEDHTIEEGFISGNYDETENDYTILVYYRAIGGRYDQLIGIGAANSKNIRN